MASPPSRSAWASLFRVAFERSDNPMVLVDMSRGILAVNRALEQSSGFKPEELIGRPLDVLIGPEQRAWLDRHWLALDRLGTFAGELEVPRAGGGRMHVQFAAIREMIGKHEVVLAVQLDQRLRPLSLASSGRADAGALTPREHEVVAGIAMGRRGPEVARDLFISPDTVRTHLRNAMTKLGARSQAQLVAIALATGTLSLKRFKEMAGLPDEPGDG